MRKTLTAAAALAPLWFAAGEAAAQTTISGSTSTPVATAASGNITISGGATVNLTSPNTAAVTVNSNNTVINNGTIQATDINGATGILAVGGAAPGASGYAIDNLGSIDLKDSKGPSTDSTTGVTQSPVAPDVNGVAPTQRIGIQEQGASPFVGNIANDTGGTIIVTGNQSYGVAIQGTVTGSVSNIGSITISGDNSVGLSVSGALNGSGATYSSTGPGNVLVTGTITATGQNSSAIVMSGDVSGRFSVYSAVTASGYGSNSRSLSNQIQADIQNAPTEVEKGGAAVVVGGNVGQGIYIGAIPANTVSSSTADADGDGIQDGVETTAAITAYGNQPGLVIGAAGKNIAIGQLQLTSTSSNANLQGYGVVIAGTVAGNGVQDGVQATGLQIGAGPVGFDVASATGDLTGDAAAIGAVATPVGVVAYGGGGTVNIYGGVQITGSVTATAYGADAIGMHVLSGSTIPTISVVGVLSGTTNQPLVNASTGNPTPYTASAYGLVIEGGANVNSLTVSGVLTASVNGDGAVNAGYSNNAYAVTDLSGSLSNVTVTGAIAAYLTPTATNLTAIGTTNALDLRFNTTGVNLTLNQAPESISTAVSSNGVTTTTVTTGPSPQSPNYTGAAIVTTVTSGSTTTTTTTPVAPTITGDVYLGSGTNTVTMNAGTITGMLQVGSDSAATATNIDLENSSTYTGKLVAVGNATFSLNINSGVFTDTYAQALTVSTLKIGTSGVFSFAIDPLHNAFTSLNVTGAAALASGAALGVNVLSNINGAQTFPLITAAGGLTVGGAPSTLAPDVPYLFTATTSITGTTLDLTIREKTPSELGMTQAEGAALPAIYAALPSNASIQSAIFGQYQRGTFIKLYNQLLPDYAGGLFQASAEASRTISRLTADPNQIENPTGSRGAWAQQFFVGAYQGRGETVPFNAGGFGYAGGVETGGLGFGAVGATVAFVAINESDPQSPTDSRIGMSELEGGLYWQGELNGLTLDARVAAGFNWFSGRRQFAYVVPATPTVATTSTTTTTTAATTTTANTTTAYTTQANGSWTGYSLTGHFGAAYEIGLGPVWFLRPQIQADYFLLDQGSYSERNGAQGFNLAIDQVNGDEVSASALMVLGAKLGRTVVWRPELQLGVRDVVTGTPGDVTGHFIGGTIPFTLDPATITGPAGVGRIKLKGSSEYYEVGIEAGVEARSRYSEGDAKLSIRVLF